MNKEELEQKIKDLEKNIKVQQDRLEFYRGKLRRDYVENN